MLEARDFFVNQAVLTGETFPVEKKAGPVAAHAGLPERINRVFMGTNVRSGTARALVVQTGASTAFGQIAERLTLRPPETEFERGIRRFGYMLTQIMTAPGADRLCHQRDSRQTAHRFAAVFRGPGRGHRPELLPAIISITLSKGAQSMAKRGVIVRQLEAIENLGSMDTLCTDKTGTLTVGVVHLDGALDVQGQPLGRRAALGLPQRPLPDRPGQPAG